MNMQVDNNNLLAPIDAAQPAGGDLRDVYATDSLYQQAKEERMRARMLEREQSYSQESSKSNQQPWVRLSELAQTILKEQAKDLEICVWLIEAHTRLYGFQGLSQALALTRSILELYWDSFYPIAVPDDPSARFAALTGLNGEANPGTLIIPLYQINITDEKIAEFTLWDYQQALQKNKDQQNNEELVLIQNAAAASGKDFAKQLYQAAKQAKKEFELLCALLEEKLDITLAPPSSRISETLTKALEMLTELYQLSPSVDADQQPLKTDDTLDDINSSNEIDIAELPFDKAQPWTRKQAFQQLQAIAEFFKKNEPNSPVPFLLERAIIWGNLSMPKLLAEMVQDQNTLMDAYRLIGVTID